jgi:hypothetical protein
MNDKLTINLNIADRIYPLRIDRQNEEQARKAAKLVGESVARYQGKYEDNNLEIKDFFAFSAFQFAYDYLKLAEEKSTEPLLDRIKDLNTDLEDFLKEK